MGKGEVPMTIRKSLLEGIRQTNRSLSAVLIVYAVNFVLAALSALLFRSVLRSAFGGSLAPEQLVHDFDYTVYSDFLARNPGRLSAIFGFVAWLVVLNNLVSAFLDGGIIAVARRGAEQFDLRSFFAACGEYFGRFVRLLIFSIPILFFAAVVMGGLAVLAFLAAVGSGETEIQIFRAIGAASVAFLLPFSILILAIDYAKVGAVAGNERRMFRAFWRGLSFVFSRLPKVYGLFILCLIPVLILIVGWAELSMHIAADTGLLVLGIFLAQQLIVLGRAWMRVATIGGQVSLFARSRLPRTQEMISTSILEPISAPKDARDWN